MVDGPLGPGFRALDPDEDAPPGTLPLTDANGVRWVPKSFWNGGPQPRQTRANGKKKANGHAHAPDEGWKSLLATNDEGATLPTVSNAVLILLHDQHLAGSLAYNDFTYRSMLRCAPPATGGITTSGAFPRAWEDADRVLIHAYLQRRYSAKFADSTVGNAMFAASHACHFHPVREYLASLIWDGLPRIGAWLGDAFGCETDPYHHAIASKFLMAAVRRVRLPGCKFDTMLLLEGAQDLGKSRACRALFGDEWFTDTLPTDLTSRDASDALTGVWGVEFSEIEHLLRSEPEEAKAFLSRQVDRYYPRYARTLVERPRQCVFIGTTNRDDYARDPSGNRRLWPATCQFADVDWIIGARDQLWAEAVQLEPNVNLWLDDAETYRTATSIQGQRYAEDPWTIRIAEWCAFKLECRIPDILTLCLNLPIERCDKSSQMRVANILRTQGWTRNKGGSQVGRKWTPPQRTGT